MFVVMNLKLAFKTLLFVCGTTSCLFDYSTNKIGQVFFFKEFINKVETAVKKESTLLYPGY